MTTVNVTAPPVPTRPAPEDAGGSRRWRNFRARLTPYLVILPGGIWLLAFFVLPMVFMLSLSLQTGSVTDGFSQVFRWQNFSDAFTNYQQQLIRSLEYGLISTILQIAIAYPIAYWLAFRAGTRKTFYLFLLLLPFFVSFVLRTQAWNFMLADNGFLLSWLKNPSMFGHAFGFHFLPQNYHILATTTAVIGGLTYNYLPFMILPIYVSLERVDPRLIEASYDLYATKLRAFRKIIFPLSLPGIFAGVVITFVPVSSDYVNAHILGGTNNSMIGNVIQNQYLIDQNYPIASALSFILMAVLLVGIFAYARALGTEEVLEVAAR